MMIKDTSYALVRRLNFIEAAIRQYQEKLGIGVVNIADIGCGTGELLTIPLAVNLGNTSTIHALEPEHLSLQVLRQRIFELNIQNIQPIQDKTALQKQSYDVIVISEVIEHVEDPIVFLNDLKSYLKPSGIMIITTPNGFGVFEIETLLFNTLDLLGVIPVMRMIKRSLRKPTTDSRQLFSADTLAISPHINFFALKDLYTIIAMTGMSLITIEGKHLLAGPFSDRILIRSKRLINLNAYLGAKFPLALVAGWMLIAKNTEKSATKIDYSHIKERDGIFKKTYSRYKRWLNVHLANKVN